jgi:hypothetical protein
MSAAPLIVASFLIGVVLGGTKGVAIGYSVVMTLLVWPLFWYCFKGTAITIKLLFFYIKESMFLAAILFAFLKGLQIYLGDMFIWFKIPIYGIATAVIIAIFAYFNQHKIMEFKAIFLEKKEMN